MTKIEKIKSKIRWIMRMNVDKNNRQRLINRNFTILASNCIGGILYHSLGLEFLSPTINVYFGASDFIKFLKNPKFYLNGSIEIVEQYEFAYPIVKCEDIFIHCVHYESVEEFKDKWVKRSKKINWDNIYVIMCERDGCTYEDICEFDKLPYENKVIFVHKNMPEIKSAYYIEGTELNGKDGQWIKPLTSYVGRMTGLRHIDRFDYVGFFNKNAREG